MRVRCITNTATDTIDPDVTVRHALSIGEVYEVIGIEAGHFRVLDDGGAPSLFGPKLFETIDASRPAHWIESTEDGTEYAYAPELNRPGFFEDYFEREPNTLRVFHRYINRHLRLNDVA